MGEQRMDLVIIESHPRTCRMVWALWAKALQSGVFPQHSWRGCSWCVHGYSCTWVYGHACANSVGLVGSPDNCPHSIQLKKKKAILSYKNGTSWTSYVSLDKCPTNLTSKLEWKKFFGFLRNSLQQHKPAQVAWGPRDRWSPVRSAGRREKWAGCWWAHLVSPFQVTSLRHSSSLPWGARKRLDSPVCVWFNISAR